MTRLDVATMAHLARWCDQQHGRNRIAVFNAMSTFLESIDGDELAAYLGQSWWHAYDMAMGLGFGEGEV